MRSILILSTTVAAMGAAMLPGCADVRSDVHVSMPSVPSAPSGFGDGERTYALARQPLRATDANPLDAECESLVQQALGRRGFAAAPTGGARYRLSVAYDTHAAAVGVADEDCAAGGDCGERAKEPFAWPGVRTFVHSLTLRFFDQTSGREVYKASASSRDRDAGSGDAMPYLVESALARVPFAGAGDGHWAVKLRRGEGGAAPGLVAVVPVRQ